MTPLEHIRAVADQCEDPMSAKGLRDIAETFAGPRFALDSSSWPDVVTALARLLARAIRELEQKDREFAAVALVLNLRSAELQLRRPKVTR
jgi:hypothetical protein